MKFLKIFKKIFSTCLFKFLNKAVDKTVECSLYLNYLFMRTILIIIHDKKKHSVQKTV